MWVEIGKGGRIRMLGLCPNVVCANDIGVHGGLVDEMT